MQSKSLLNSNDYKTKVFGYFSWTVFWNFNMLGMGILWLVIHYKIINSSWSAFEFPFVITVIIFSLVSVIFSFMPPFKNRMLINKKMLKFRKIIKNMLELITIILWFVPIYYIVNESYFKDSQDWYYKKTGYKFILCSLFIIFGINYIILSIFSWRNFVNKNMAFNHKQNFSQSNSQDFKMNSLKNIFVKLNDILNNNKDKFYYDFLDLVKLAKDSIFKNKSIKNKWGLPIVLSLFISLYTFFLVFDFEEKNIIILLISCIVLISIATSYILTLWHQYFLWKSSIKHSSIHTNLFWNLNSLLDKWGIKTDFVIRTNDKSNHDIVHGLNMSSHIYNVDLNLNNDKILFLYKGSSYAISNNYGTPDQIMINDEFVKGFLEKVIKKLNQGFIKSINSNFNKKQNIVKGEITFNHSQNKNLFQKILYSILLILLLSSYSNDVIGGKYDK